MLCEVYGEECLSRARVFEWHKRFCSGREDVEDDDRSGRPTTSSTNENVEKIDKIIRQDRRLSVRAVAEMVNIDRESVRKILIENLNIKKVCAKMVPKNLMIDQKFNRKEICSDTLKIIKDDPSFINNIITCDETWIFTYDPETKRQSMHWRTPTSPRMKKARMSKSKFKAMLIVFFDIKGIIFVEWVPCGQTVNQYYYKEVLIKLRERVRKKRPDLWKNGWVLHQDNAPAHSAFSIQRFLIEKKISVLQHPPYSPDLAPCDFFLFPKIKSFLKGTHFQTVDDVKMKTAELLKELNESDWQHCFQEWQRRMQQCIDAEGRYFEAGMMLQGEFTSNLHMVYCVSKTTTNTEQNYHSSKLELYAIIWTLGRLRHLLLGIKFTILTDCQALVYLNIHKTTKPQVARWFNTLHEFDFEIKYRPGGQMAYVDALSRTTEGAGATSEPMDTIFEVIEKFCQERGIHHTLNSTRHPQANGQVERVNRTPIPILSIISVEQCHWDQKLTEIEKNLNTAYNKAIKKTPYETVHGYYPNFRSGAERQLNLNRNLWTSSHKVQLEARFNIEEQQVKTKEAYDKTKFAGTHLSKAK
ncbi:hypothetical protein QTP88_026717 [Uroleucon formosanum]